MDESERYDITLGLRDNTRMIKQIVLVLASDLSMQCSSQAKIIEIAKCMMHNTRSPQYLSKAMF